MTPTSARRPSARRIHFRTLALLLALACVGTSAPLARAGTATQLQQGPVVPVGTDLAACSPVLRCAANNPTFLGAVRAADGFTTSITNYDPAFAYSITTTAGAVRLSGNRIVVTLLSPGQSATVTVRTSRYGYFNGIGSVAGQALYAARIPQAAAVTATTDGFTLRLANFDPLFTWRASPGSGSARIDGAGLVTISGLTPGAATQVTISTSRAGFVSGTRDFTGQALFAARTPALTRSTSTADGFTVPIDNFDAAWTWNAATVAYGSTPLAGRASVVGGVVHVTGLTSRQAAVVQVTSSRTGYVHGMALFGGTALEAWSAPTVGPVTPTPDGFTVQVTDFNADSSYSARIVDGQPGSVWLSSTGLATVTGLTPGASSTIEISAWRTGYGPGKVSVTGQAQLGAALQPVLGAVTRTFDGFTVSVLNPDPAWNIRYVSTAGFVQPCHATVGACVSDLPPDTEAHVWVRFERPGYVTGVAEAVGRSLAAPLIPEFGPSTRLFRGFSFQISNFDANWTWSAAASAGVATMSSTGLVTVTGLSDGQASHVTVTARRTGYADGADSFAERSLAAAFVPSTTTPVSTADGFRFSITSLDSAFRWTVTTTGGSVSLNTVSRIVTVSGLGPGRSARVDVRTERAGYVSGLASVTGTALMPPVLPTFGTPVRGNGKVTVTLTNLTPSVTTTVTASAGTAVRSGSTITVSGLFAGQFTTITVSYRRATYVTGTSSVRAAALSAPRTPFLQHDTGLRWAILNYHPSWSWTATSSHGVARVIPMGTTYYVVVTSAPAGQTVSVRVWATRAGYLPGTRLVTGQR